MTNVEPTANTNKSDGTAFTVVTGQEEATLEAPIGETAVPKARIYTKHWRWVSILILGYLTCI